MYLWRRPVAPQWLTGNEDNLRSQVGYRLAIIERPVRKRALLEVACHSRGEARDLAKKFGGRIDKLPRDWVECVSREQEGKPSRIGKRLIVINVGGTSLRRRSRFGAQEAASRRNGFGVQDSVSRWSRHRGSSYIFIPAGAAFGTGQHVTTVMSLRLLEQITRRWKPGWSIADLGTGSGILALAAKRFGASRALAIDLDPTAISTAKENARLNKVEKVDFEIGDLLQPKNRHENFDVITANLFSELLVKALPIWKPRLKQRGWMILSGILRHQETRLIGALRRNKIDIAQVRCRGKWIAILAGKTHRPSGTVCQL